MLNNCGAWGIPVALAALAVWVGSCSPHAPKPGTPQPTSPPSATASSSVSSAPPVERPRSLVLAQPRPEPLDFEVWPTASERFVLLVASDALRDWAHVRAVDADGKLGPLHTVIGRRPVQGVWLGKPQLLTSDTENLCLEALDGAGPPSCHRLRADRAVVNGERLLLLEQRAPDDDDDDDRKGIEMELWVHVMEVDGSLGEPVDSGLRFAMPLPGMGLIDAVATRRGVQLLWYDEAKQPSKRRRSKPRARLRTGLLDDEGKLIADSESTLLEGGRAYGYIEGHQDPRLVARGGRAIFVGRFRDESAKPVVVGWEVTRLPGHQTVRAPVAVVETDPGRLTKKDPVSSDESAFYATLAMAMPRLVEHQSIHDAGRVAWAGDVGLFRAGGELRRAQRHARTIVAMKPPFAAVRAPLFWGAVDDDGSALALGADGLISIAADGTVTHYPTPSSSGIVRAIGAPVKIAGGWWLMHASGTPSGATLERLLPSEEAPPILSDGLFDDATRLVGGQDRGLLLRWHAGWLHTDALDPDGRLGPLADAPAVIGAGFEAVERASGGAIVVGPSINRSQLVALTVAPGGAIGAPHELGLAPGRGFAVQALPFGGAVAFNRARTEVVWLDDAAAPLAHAAWPAADRASACRDGSPLRNTWPSLTAGVFQPLSAEVSTGRCWVSLPRWTEGGLAWLGSRVHELDSAAEAVVLEGTAPAPTHRKTAAMPMAATPSASSVFARASPAPPTWCRSRGATASTASRLSFSTAPPASPCHRTTRPTRAG